MSFYNEQGAKSEVLKGNKGAPRSLALGPSPARGSMSKDLGCDDQRFIQRSSVVFAISYWEINLSLLEMKYHLWFL